MLIITAQDKKNQRIVSVCLFNGCLTSQQHVSVSQGRICSDSFTCCLTEVEVADQTFYLTQSQYTDTGLTSPSADPIMPGAWQGSHWSANLRHWYDSTLKKFQRKRDSNAGSSALEADALSTRPTRRWIVKGLQPHHHHLFPCSLPSQRKFLKSWCWLNFHLLLLHSQLYLWGSPFWVRFLRMWPF